MRNLFIVFAQEDAEWRASISRMLTPGIGDARVEWWDESRTGDIRKALDAADVALLLVSPAFLASKFMQDDALPSLLRDAFDEGVTVLWALLSQSAWKTTPIAEFQAVSSTTEPLDTLPAARRDEELARIADKVIAAVEAGRVDVSSNGNGRPPRPSLDPESSTGVTPFPRKKTKR